MTEQEAHYIVEMVAQSHETDREDLPNEDVITVPVVAGPYSSTKNCQADLARMQDANESYEWVTFHEDDPEFIDV